VKDMANATVGVFRKLELSGSIKWGIQVEAERNKREAVSAVTVG
jgi:hypothetical protein